MRAVLIAVIVFGLLMPAASAATEQRREASFPMAQGFEDRLTIVSGTVAIDAPNVSGSAGFFRTSEVRIGGLTKVCWALVGSIEQCADGALSLVVPAGSSFGFSSPVSYPVEVSAVHGLVTFVDLSKADGFDGRLHVGPSTISSLVDGRVGLGRVPAFSGQERGGISLLEPGSVLDVRNAAGLLIRTVRFDDAPLLFEGTPTFPSSFGAQVVVLPFDQGASARFAPAAARDAKAGLAQDRIDLLDEVLGNVRILGPAAKEAPFAILDRAGAILSEVFNGAFLRTRLADDPQGLGDVAFAKFSELAVHSGDGTALDFDGSYTLVVGDLGTSFRGSHVSDESTALRWWVGAFLVLAILVVGAWALVRGGPLEPAPPGPHRRAARIATAVGAVAALLVWDWQLRETLGASLLATQATGSALGTLILIEVASLLLAALLIGLPAFLAVRYGLALAGKPRHAGYATTVAVVATVAVGVLILPALVSMLAALAA